MSAFEYTYLNSNPPSVGRRGDEVTLHVHGEAFAMKPGVARVLAHRLERKADLADPEGARR